MVERLEPITPMGPIITAPAAISFSRVTGASLDIEVMSNDQLVEASAGLVMELRANNQPIEAYAGHDVEVRTNDQPVEVDASPDMEARASSQPVEEVPLSLQGVVEILGLMVEGSIEIVVGEVKSPMVVGVLEMLVKGSISAKRALTTDGSISPFALSWFTTRVFSVGQ